MPLYRGSRRLILRRNVPVAGGGFSLTYQSSSFVNSTGPSVTYNGSSAMSFGSSNTRVIAAITWARGSTETISSVTVGGTSFTQVASAFGGNTIGASDIWESNSSIAGTSGVAVVVFSGSIGNATSIALYNLQTATPTVSHATSTNVFNTTSGTVTPIVPAGGVAIIASGSYGFSASDSSFTAGATQDIDLSPTITVLYGHTITTGSVPVTVTYNANAGSGISAAAWGP